MTSFPLWTYRYRGYFIHGDGGESCRVDLGLMLREFRAVAAAERFLRSQPAKAETAQPT